MLKQLQIKLLLEYFFVSIITIIFCGCVIYLLKSLIIIMKHKIVNEFFLLLSILLTIYYVMEYIKYLCNHVSTYSSILYGFIFDFFSTLLIANIIVLCSQNQLRSIYVGNTLYISLMISIVSRTIYELQLSPFILFGTCEIAI